MKETTLFMNGSSQAIRIPKEMRFSSDKVLIEKIGSITVIIDPSDPWASLKIAQIMFAGSFMPDGRVLNPIIERQGLLPKEDK
jgi:antitoxin VapB